MKKCSIPEAAAEEIKAKGAPEPGMRYKIVGDTVTEVCARTGEAHFRSSEQERSPVQTGKAQTYTPSRATKAQENQSPKALDRMDRPSSSGTDNMEEDGTIKAPRAPQKFHDASATNRQGPGKSTQAQHHGHQTQQWHAGTKQSHAWPFHGLPRARDLAHASPFATGTDASVPTATATRIPIQPDGSDDQTNRPATSRKRSKHDDPGAEREKRRKPDWMERRAD